MVRRAFAGFFEGEATSEVGKTKAPRTLGVMQPDLSRAYRVIGAQGPAFCRRAKLSGAEQTDPQVQAVVARLRDRWSVSSPTAHRRPAARRGPLRQPFVVWFWLGVIVAVGGTLFAIWPAQEGARRRVSDVYGARLARSSAAPTEAGPCRARAT